MTMTRTSDVQLEQQKSIEDRSDAEASEQDAGELALCMSGGGYRAAVFHLGALLRLHEVGLLHACALLSAVSGGSIVQAWLATRYVGGRNEGEGFASWLSRIDFRAGVVEAFRAVARRDLRTWPILATLAHNWAWPRHRVQLLEAGYRRALGETTLGELPQAPEFVFCATDMTFGVNWEFRRQRAGDWLAGYLKAHEDITLAHAVACSSAFPPFFGPVRVQCSAGDFSRGKYRGADRDRLLARIDLTDGGVYDNLATEPAFKRRFGRVLVSDAGAPFAFRADAGIRRLLRYTQVVQAQSVSLRKRLYFTRRSADLFSGAYWALVGEERDGPVGYGEALVREVIGRFRTDLDGLDDAEFEVLCNHGYGACANALLEMAGPTEAAAATWPFPDWADEDRVRVHLGDSHRRRWLGKRR